MEFLVVLFGFYLYFSNIITKNAKYILEQFNPPQYLLYQSISINVVGTKRDRS